MKLFLAVFSMLLGSGVAVAQNYPLPFQMSDSDRPKASVNPREVYGTIRYEIKDFRTQQKMRSLVQYLAETLKAQEGEYILTLQIADILTKNVVAREAIAHFKVSEQRVLVIFKKSMQDVVARSWKGQLLADAPPIRGDNNAFTVEVKTVYTQKGTIDWDLFNNLVKVANRASIEFIKLPTDAPQRAAWDEVQKVISGIFDTFKKDDITDKTIMSFTTLQEGNKYHNKLSVKTPFNQVRQAGDILFEIRFDTIPSKVGIFDVNKKVFKNPSVTSYLQTTISGKPLLEFLLSAPVTAKFQEALLSSDKYSGNDTGDQCTKVKELLNQNLTVRDSHAVYWAWVHRFEDKLKKNNNYQGCVPDYLRSEMNALALASVKLLK